MNPKAFFLILTAFCLFVTENSYASPGSLALIAEKAVSGRGEESTDAIKRLRFEGPIGLKALLDRYSSEIANFRAGSIDFGDGRKIERTITGNSIHYVIDGDGRII